MGRNLFSLYQKYNVCEGRIIYKFYKALLKLLAKFLCIKFNSYGLALC